MSLPVACERTSTVLAHVQDFGPEKMTILVVYLNADRDFAYEAIRRADASPSSSCLA